MRKIVVTLDSPEIKALEKEGNKSAISKVSERELFFPGEHPAARWYYRPVKRVLICAWRCCRRRRRALCSR